MARVYTNENVPLEIVGELRRLGHDVLATFEAGNANWRVQDPAMLAFAAGESRVLVTNNRRDFIGLHRTSQPRVGIVVFTFQPDAISIAGRISAALADSCAAGRFLARVDGNGFTYDAPPSRRD